MSHVEKEVLVNGKNISLRIEGSPEIYAFSYSTDGTNYITLGQMNTRFISSEAGGGFTGAYIALYAQKISKSSKAKGVFSEFEYIPM